MVCFRVFFCWYSRHIPADLQSEYFGLCWRKPRQKYITRRPSPLVQSSASCGCCMPCEWIPVASWTGRTFMGLSHAKIMDLWRHEAKCKVARIHDAFATINPECPTSSCSCSSTQMIVIYSLEYCSCGGHRAKPWKWQCWGSERHLFDRQQLSECAHFAFLDWMDKWTLTVCSTWKCGILVENANNRSNGRHVYVRLIGWCESASCRLYFRLEDTWQLTKFHDTGLGKMNWKHIT